MTFLLNNLAVQEEQVIVFRSHMGAMGDKKLRISNFVPVGKRRILHKAVVAVCYDAWVGYALE